MKSNNINTMKRGSRSVVSTTLATAYIEHIMSIYSAYIGTRWQTGGKLLRLAAMMCLLFTLGVGNAWGTETETTLAAWSFTSSSYPSNNSNFNATSGTMSTNSTFCMNGSGSTWNSAAGKGYAFTSVSSVVITLKLNQKLAAGAQITLAADVFYNKASNKPVGSYAITTKVGSAAASSTGVGTTTWTLSTSSANKTSTYTTQAEIASGTTIQFILTASGSSGSGQAYFNNVTIKSTTYTVTYNANSGSGSVPTDATAYCSKAIVTVKGNTGPVSRDGYTFGGWNTNTSGTGTNYTAGSGTFTITANTTLYAKWTAAASEAVTGVTVAPTSKTIFVGETFDITPTVAPANATNKNVSWSSSASGKASVSSGTVTGVAAGTATITCTTADGGYTATCATTVYSASVTSIVDEEGTDISSSGVSASVSGRTLTASEGSTKYKFKTWKYGTASGTTISSATSLSTSLSGTPTGNVTLIAEFYKPVEVVWTKGGTTYSTGGPTTSVKRGTQWKDLDIPTAPGDASLGSCADKFMGWSNCSDLIGTGHSAPGVLFTSVSGITTAINEPIEFKAVFATESDGGVSWDQITDATDVTAGTYVIVASTSTKTGYLPTAESTDTGPLYTTTGLTISEGKITSSVTDAMKWTFSTGSWDDDYDYMEGISITNQDDTPLYLNNTNANNGVRVDDTSDKTWTIGNHESGASDVLYMWCNGRYCGVYSNTDWRSYTTYDATNYTADAGSSKILLFKENDLRTYSDYVTKCCTKLGYIGGSVEFTDPTTAVLTWNKMSNVAVSNPYTISYRTGSAAYGTSNVGAVDLTGSKATCTITGLSCNTDYDFKIEVAAASNYCDKDSVMEDQNSGKYAITLTDDGEVTGGLFTSDAEEACASDVIILEAAPNTGYAFSNWDITYTDSGDDAWDDVNGDDDDLVSDEIVIEMPAADITVNAVFSCISTTVTVGPTTAAGNYGWRYTTEETIDLTCTASGATPTGYQWQKYIGSAWEDIDGATTARFQKASCTSSDGGSYRCVVTTGTGCSFQSDGYFIRIFTFDGNYSGESWTKNAITWTGENTGTVTLSLDESSIYEFKVYDNDGKTFGNGTGNYIIQPVNWDCGTGNSNCRLFTGPEGNYTFTLNISHAGDNSPYVNVQVAYPSVTHPVEGYAYVSKWWNCYPHFWDGSGNALTPDGYDPQLTTYTTICEVDYWYFPVLATYVNVAVKDNATWASAGNNSGNQTTTDHSGMYLTHDGSWGWHDFESYTITFVGNGNSGGSMSDVSNICPGADRDLAENGYTKTGYHFDGWKTNVAITINTGGEDTDIAANGIVADEATIKDISSDITLTAQWAANTNTPYLVKHYKQNLDGSYPSTPTETDELTGTSDASVTPARKSYTGFTAPAGTTTTISADGSLVVEYQYTRNSYTLTWSLDGGSISSAGTAAGSVKYGATLTAPTVTKTGYTFNAWSPAVPATMPAEAATYTATWNAITYTITYEGLSGASNTNPTSYNIETETITLADPGTRTGYTFAGWTCGGDEITQIANGSTGDKTITANWTINQYNVAVEAVAGVTITATPAGSSAIEEGDNADVDYNKSVTLAYSGLETGIYWVGWKVTNAGGDDVTASVVSENTLTVPAYAVTVTAVLGKMKAWCMPEFEITGDVYLTSVKGVYVNSTSTTGDLLTLSGTNTENVTRISIDYLDNNGDVVASKASSPLRLRTGDNAGYVESDITSGFSTGTYSGSFSVRFTPTAYNELDNYTLRFTIKKGSRVLKTIEHPIHGRALPAEFVLAIKKGDNWYALPNTILDNNRAITPTQIEVDDASTPTLIYAPSTTIYKGYETSNSRYAAGTNIYGVRLTDVEGHWLQVSSSSSTNYVWVSGSGSSTCQDWWLSSSDFGAYTLKVPSSGAGDKRLGINNLSNIGFYASDAPNLCHEVYILPVDVDYFIGGVSGHEDEWSQTENWESGSLPTAGSIVRILAPATIGAAETRHVAEVQIVTGGTTSHYKSGASECEGQLSIAAGGELIVTTTIKKCADASAFGTLTATTSSDLAIESDASHGLGGLVMGDHDGTNKATVNFTTLSHGVSGSTASVAQYVGTPFNDETNILYNWYNSWVYGITYSSNVIGWTRVNEGSGMDPFKGYCVFSAAGGNHVYWQQGTLNATSNQTISGLNWQSGEGAANPNNENLLANGWMAPIKIKAFKAEDFVKTDASIYIFNSGSPDDYDAIGASYGSGAGQYQTYSINTAEDTDVIPAMQSFSVYTNASGGSSVTLDYKRLVYDPAVAGTTPVPNRAPLATKNADEANKLKLFVKAESGYGDMLYMWEREDFTDYFENGWDARKVFGETTAPQLYAVTPDGNMAVNCVPTFEGVVMGFKAGDNENFYTFTFECDDEAEALYLVDTDNNAYTRVLSTNSYWFTTSDKEAHNRFILTHNAPGSTTGIDNTGNVQGTKAYKVIMHDKMYIIYGDEMYDATGKRVNEIK